MQIECNCYFCFFYGDASSMEMTHFSCKHHVFSCCFEVSIWPLVNSNACCVLWQYEITTPVCFLHNSSAIKVHKGLCLIGPNVRPLLIRSINLKASYSWLLQTTFKRSFIDTQTGPAPSMPVIKQALPWHLLIVPGAQRVLATDQAMDGQ